jgi:tetratricopeptide (TPR) repeat protein
MSARRRRVPNSKTQVMSSEAVMEPQAHSLGDQILNLRKKGSIVPPPDALKQRVVREYSARFGLQTLVETGTYKGDMIYAVAGQFREIHSIELSRELFEEACQRFAAFDHVHLHQGDSATVLPKLLKTLHSPILFWLDAHYSSGTTARGGKDTPIVEELGVIYRDNPTDHVILIDDARDFTGTDDYPSLNQLRRLVEEWSPGTHFEVSDDIIRLHYPKPTGNGKGNTPWPGMKGRTENMTAGSRLPKAARDCLEQSEICFKKGELAEARVWLQRMLDIAPNEFEALAALGNLSFQLNDMPAAGAAYARAAKQRPEDAVLHVQLALTCLELEDIPGFERALGRALELDGNCVEALRALGDLNARKGNHQAAVNAYRRILARTPDDIGVHLLLGRSLFETSQYTEAEMTYSRVLESEPGNEIARDNLAVVRRKLRPAPAPPAPAARADTGNASPESLIAQAAALCSRAGRLNYSELKEYYPTFEEGLDAWITPRLGFSMTPNPRGWVFPQVEKKFEGWLDSMRQHAAEVIPFIHSPKLAAIPEEKVDEVTPYWRNGYFHPGDARLAYAMIARHRPRRVIECGCGNATKFMRRAAMDYRTATRILCIDPEPRPDICGVADEFHQASAATIDPACFDQLQAGDFLFVNGSHLVMNGSDCVHLFLDVLPRLKPGVWVHFHDVFLPHDYAYDHHVSCRYNEQYLLAMLFLYSENWLPALPIYYGYKKRFLPYGGGSFWMRRIK